MLNTLRFFRLAGRKQFVFPFALELAARQARRGFHMIGDDFPRLDMSEELIEPGGFEHALCPSSCTAATGFLFTRN